MSDPGDETTKPEQPTEELSPDKIDVAIDTWVNTHLRNSPISEQVGAWNHLVAKLPLLRKYLTDAK